MAKKAQEVKNDPRGAVGRKPAMRPEAFADKQTGTDLPYYPSFNHLVTAIGAPIGARTYIGRKDENPAPERIKRATPEGVKNLS